MAKRKSRPNVLVLMVDEFRYPTVYDGPELRKWMEKKLRSWKMLARDGVELNRHYVMSTACAPSRTSLFTGEYPSLHGVTQTDGAAKNAWDPEMFWLDPNTVPTLGDWFRAAGYRTYYKGKWHISFADIVIPDGTHDSLATTKIEDGEASEIPENVDYYAIADRLEEFGFSGWIGPEPHGRSQANSGWVRDPYYCDQALSLLDALDSEKRDDPWLIVNSYVNPHDIVFFGIMWKSFGYAFTDPSIPSIPPPPTQGEDLSTKPRAQASYIEVYPNMLLPQPTVELYRQFYYFLQQRVDQYVVSVIERLRKSRFADDTIVLLTSDHGEMLGAHGGAHQKWYNAYEETIHVPFVISGPDIKPGSINQLTSHADLAPTLLGLAGVDVRAAQAELAKSHTETRRLVGRDLSGVLLGKEKISAGEPVYFMTSDDVSRGLNQTTAARPYEPVIQPNQLETIVVDLDGVPWKYTRYFDQPYSDTRHLPEFEMYNLKDDPTEVTNLADPALATGASEKVRATLHKILGQQRSLKRLQPGGAAVTRKGGEGSEEL